MPRYFAEIVNGVVERVIVADSLEWCVEHLGGEWKETFMDNPNKNYAGVGHKYDKISDNFISEKPYPSWILTDKQKWEAPVLQTEKDTYWDKENNKWEKVPELKLK